MQVWFDVAGFLFPTGDTQFGIIHSNTSESPLGLEAGMSARKLHLSASTQLAVLAVALSSWVEGSAQLRTYAVSNLSSEYLDEAPLEEYSVQDAEPPSGHWAWEWIKRKAKPLDDVERATVGALDVAVSDVEP